MLYYCRTGKRNYYRKPVRIYSRAYWEFMVFLEGQSCPAFSSGGGKGGEDNFWVFRPDCPHGWRDREDRECEVAVFHFAEVPDQLARRMEETAFLSCRAGEDALREIAATAGEVRDEVRMPRENSLLHFHLILLKLSYLFLENARLPSLPVSREEQIVNAALAWFSTHMEEGVGVEETADRMGYNVSHLRRLFQKVRGGSPREIFLQLKMDRARGLLRQGTPVMETALACGFSSHSSFTRAFTAFTGSAPRELSSRS